MAFEYLETLNGEQLKAVTYGDGYELVLAGAGTGKTKMLTARAAFLIESGVPASRILMLTFTNAAANEMKKRITEMLGAEAGGITVKTFHGWCVMFLKQVLGPVDGARFCMLDDSDAQLALRSARKKVLDETDLKAEGIGKKDIPDSRWLVRLSDKILIRRYRNTVKGDDPLSFEEGLYLCLKGDENMSDAVKDIVKKIMGRYTEYKTEHEYFDYNDLLCETDRLLSENAELRAAWGNRYRYVLCDEYQDTDMVQERILEALASVNGNLTVVGDDAQSIYGFRGACVENIRTFTDRYPGAVKITLFRNYRSSQEILDLSNAVMSHDRAGMTKTLRSERTGMKPEYITADDDNVMREIIVNRIRAKHDAGIPYREMAVLDRKGRPLKALESEFRKNGIPYRLCCGDGSVFDRVVVKDILRMIRLTVNGQDREALRYILCSKINDTNLINGIGDKTANLICDIAGTRGMQALASCDGFASKSFAPYVGMLGQMLLDIDGMTPAEMLDFLITRGHFENFAMMCIADSHRKTPVDRDDFRMRLKDGLADAGTLCDVAGSYDSAEDFISDMGMGFNTDADPDRDCVTLSTIHSVKGLEYDSVILMDVLAGVMPNENESDDMRDEDLRCLYVALTRAKNDMLVINPGCMRINNMGYTCISPACISPFLDHDDVMRCFNVA